jgi:hypothetical protein
MVLKFFNDKFQYEYDKNGNKISKIDYTSSNNQIYPFDKQTWKYNENNVLLEEAYYQYYTENNMEYLNPIYHHFYTYKDNLLVEKSTKVKGLFLNNKTQYLYDEKQNLVRELDLKRGNDDEFYLIKTTAFRYNDQNKVTVKIVEDFYNNGSDNSFEKWTYYLNGDLESYTSYEENDLNIWAPYKKEAFEYNPTELSTTKSYLYFNEEINDWELDYVVKTFVLNKNIADYILPHEFDIDVSKEFLFDQYWICRSTDCSFASMKSIYYYSEKPTNTLVINEHKMDVSIFPNPFSEQINITPPQNSLPENMQIQIYSIAGNLVFESEIQNNQVNNLILSYLTSGTYIFKIISPTQTVSKIIVKI